MRWHIEYKETEFFINLDHVNKPDMGHFLEIKSRTWSRKDADLKAELVNELLNLLGVGGAEVVTQDYIEILTA
jgi:5-methylthioadenosine/S-adenosylhomocysteine deaminase